MDELIISSEPKYQVQNALSKLDLLPSEKLLLHTIDRYRNPKVGDGVFPCMRKLSKEVCLTRNHVGKLCAKLAAAGYLIIVDRYMKDENDNYRQKSNLYYLTRLIFNPTDIELKQEILSLKPRASQFRTSKKTLLSVIADTAKSVIITYSNKKRVPPVLVGELPKNIPIEYPPNDETNNFNTNTTQIPSMSIEKTFNPEGEAEANTLIDQYIAAKISKVDSAKRKAFIETYKMAGIPFDKVQGYIAEYSECYFLRATTFSPLRIFEKADETIRLRNDIKARTLKEIEKSRAFGQPMDKALQTYGLGRWFSDNLEAMRGAINFICGTNENDDERNRRMIDEAREAHYEELRQIGALVEF